MSFGETPPSRPAKLQDTSPEKPAVVKAMQLAEPRPKVSSRKV